MRRMLVTVVGVVVTGLAGSAGPAEAADHHRVDARPERVAVDHSYENVRWSVRNDGCLSDADATLEHVGSRAPADYEYDGTTGDGLGTTLRLYDYERMGRYRVYGGGWNDCAGDGSGSYTASGADYLWVKRAARARIDGDRHRRYVTLRAKVRQYHGGYPTWTNHRGARVVFQRRTPRGWRVVDADRTNRRGVAEVAFRRARRSPYRAVVKPTTTVWGDRSERIRR